MSYVMRRMEIFNVLNRGGVFRCVFLKDYFVKNGMVLGKFG